MTLTKILSKVRLCVAAMLRHAGGRRPESRQDNPRVELRSEDAVEAEKMLDSFESFCFCK